MTGETIKEEKGKKNLLNGLGDLGADTVAGEESCRNGSGGERPSGGGSGEDLVGAASESAPHELLERHDCGEVFVEFAFSTFMHRAEIKENATQS